MMSQSRQRIVAVLLTAARWGWISLGLTKAPCRFPRHLCSGAPTGSSSRSSPVVFSYRGSPGPGPAGSVQLEDLAKSSSSSLSSPSVSCRDHHQRGTICKVDCPDMARYGAMAS